MNIYIKSVILSFFFISVGARAQEASFTPPFDFPIIFSGNFGEIRANHFHGGLDFKTGGAIGKPVRALADGYISRIRSEEQRLNSSHSGQSRMPSSA